jgi:hypothetical protein
MICWLLPTATPFKSYRQLPEHSVMPTTARNPVRNNICFCFLLELSFALPGVPCQPGRTFYKGQSYLILLAVYIASLESYTL